MCKPYTVEIKRSAMWIFVWKDEIVVRIRLIARSWAWEVLYLAVAIATASHTMWSLSYAFEGVEPVEGSLGWVLRGLLLAVAVDVGMFVTSRFLASATTRLQVASLVGAFGIAALVSAYAQLLYVVIHTPVIPISAGVTDGWGPWLAPLLAARVVILPLALPALCTVYTVARYAHQPPRQVSATSLNAPSEVQVSRMVGEVPTPLLDEQTGPREAEDKLRDGLEWVLDCLTAENGNDVADGEKFSGCDLFVDMGKMTVTQVETGRTWGPYRSRSSMVGALRQASRRQAPR